MLKVKPCQVYFLGGMCVLSLCDVSWMYAHVREGYQLCAGEAVTGITVYT